MQNNPRNHSIFIGLLLIMAGIIVFLVNLGYGSWDIIRQLLKLWPVIFILIGIRIIWQGPSSQWFSYGFWLLVTLGIIGLLLMNPKSNTGSVESGSFNPVTVNRSDYPGVTGGKAIISLPGGQIAFGSNTKEWLQGDFGGFKAQNSVKNIQNNLTVHLKQTGHIPKHWRQRNHSEWNDNQQPDDYRWDIQLSPDLPWNIELESLGIKGDADLSNIPVKEFLLKMGGGDFGLTLGNKSETTRVKISGGGGHIKIKVPKDSGIQVKVSGLAVHTNLNTFTENQGWNFMNRNYVSPGYEKAANHLDIHLEMAGGYFELAEY